MTAGGTAGGTARATAPGPAADAGRRAAFLHVLGNTLVASIVNFTVWFAITFWVYLETRSVFATGVISGIYLVLTALSGIWFGSLVDHYRKKHGDARLERGVVRALRRGFAVYLLGRPGAVHRPGEPACCGRSCCC